MLASVFSLEWFVIILSKKHFHYISLSNTSYFLKHTNSFSLEKDLVYSRVECVGKLVMQLTVTKNLSGHLLHRKA